MSFGLRRRCWLTSRNMMIDARRAEGIIADTADTAEW